MLLSLNEEQRAQLGVLVERRLEAIRRKSGKFTILNRNMAIIQGRAIWYSYWTDNDGSQYKLNKIAQFNSEFRTPQHHYTIDVADFNSLDNLSFEIARILVTFALSGAPAIDHLILTEQEQSELNKQQFLCAHKSHTYYVWRQGQSLDLKNYKTFKELMDAIHSFEPTHTNSQWGALDALATLLIRLLNKA